MGYVVCFAPCINCRRPFGFNPNLVPSVRINGEREPICQGCVGLANPIRIAHGLDPIVILPGAYDAADENEL
jgi:hypothetical protein